MYEVSLRGTDKSYAVGKIVCLGRNYHDHIRELGNQVPDRAVIFCKPASSLIGGSGTGDIYKIFAIAQRDDVAFRLISVPKEFELEAEEPFDPVYMKALYDVGYEYGLAGDRWAPRPLDFTPWP